MTDEEIEARARELQREPFPYGPPREPPPWEALVEASKEGWRAKARAGVLPGQAAAEAEADKARKAAEAQKMARTR